MRGEHAAVLAFAVILTGSPPHARGALLMVTARAACAGITPACAGSTTRSESAAGP